VRSSRGKITWGGYATAAYVRHLMVSRKLAVANAQIDRKIGAIADQESQRRQLAARQWRSGLTAAGAESATADD